MEKRLSKCCDTCKNYNSKKEFCLASNSVTSSIFVCDYFVWQD